MRRNRLLLFAPLMVALAMGGLAASPLGLRAADLPDRLTDQEFWRLTEDFSEPNGAFASDNLLSNERVFARLVPELITRAKPGGVYLGVGPEQNFTYIAAIRPRLAFITDIRRGNLHLQLMYKALFELSADRSEFVARLFTKPRAIGVTATSTAPELMNAYWDAFTGDEAAYAANLQAIRNHLTKSHAFPLSAEDLSGIAAVYRAFYWYGPSITWSARTSLAAPAATLTVVSSGTITYTVGGATYSDIVTQSDGAGQGLSYLASEEKFAFVKELERRNLIVPVVGDFSGPKALRAVGAYLKDRGTTITAFYLSNVESYLHRAGTWPAFCANVATMPLDDGSLFIRPSGSGVPRTLPFATVVGGRGSDKIRIIGVPPTTPPGVAPVASTGGLVPIATEVRECGK